ncbi:MAG: alpha/beta hydrolase [Bryobacteraceae bacterium]|nr:alpha/beta hydrolase [Bryobacteraceae bacterium]
MAYRDSAPESTRPVVFLIHGSPGDGAILGRLSGLISPNFRVILPDLPGFGGSTHNLPDYSFVAHARYMAAMMEQLKIRRAQFVGFSMGGGVILSLQNLTPQRVQSLVLLSAIGDQQFEMTGNYHLNHAIHGLQLGALWLIYNVTPHFGLLDQVIFDVPYARNFYDSDQRPLRGILEKYRGPLLILHGSRDPLVDARAAEEHHRLVPGSKLVMYDDDHFMSFLHPEALTVPLNEFLLTNAQ